MKPSLLLLACALLSGCSPSNEIEKGNYKVVRVVDYGEFSRGRFEIWVATKSDERTNTNFFTLHTDEAMSVGDAIVIRKAP